MFRSSWSKMSAALIIAAAFILVIFMTSARADQNGDWPMWRHDAAHTAATPNALPDALTLQWTLDLGRPEPAWPWTQDKLQFDAAAEPVVLGETIFVPSSRTDSVAAYDIKSGKMRWRFFAQGPVRLPPVAADGRVWFGSDDGCLYCLDAATGAQDWKFRGVPSEHKTLGNERVVSTWPVRGGPVLDRGRIYFAAGLWPSMGVYIYALDAATGKVVWLNSGEGSVWQDQPHAPPAKSFSGVAPQGALAVAGDKLLVPSGRAVPAAFDLATGRFLYARFADRILGKDAGGHAVAAVGDFFFCGPGHNRPSELGNNPGFFELANGKALRKTRATVLTASTAYEFEQDTLQGLDISNGKLVKRWSFKIPGCTEVFCMAGDRLYCGGERRIVAIDEGTHVTAWEAAIEGTPASAIAARERLFVSTLEGKLYCFGEGKARSTEDKKEENVASGGSDLLTLGEREGYCIVAGVSEGGEIEGLVGQSKLCVIGLTADAEVARKLRERWADLGIPFSRASILEGTIGDAQLPPYLANLIVWQGSAPDSKTVADLFRSLRPYGGKAYFAKASKESIEQAAKEAGLEGYRVNVQAEAGAANGGAVLERAGALPGAGSWTHNYGDAGNSVFSPDRLAKAPLGILWYGGNDHNNVLPRHGHGPTEQVVGGRLIIEGPDHLSARDVYTGRPLWERALPGVGANFDNTNHEAGANHMGSNYASAEDGIYVAYGKQGLRLDPATGETITTYTLKSPAGEPLEFAQFKLAGDLMVVSAGPQGYDKTIAGTSKSWNLTGSRYLFVMDRRSGRILWQRAAENLFHHNTVIVGGDTVFAIDRLAPTPLLSLARGGPEATAYTLLALGLRDGGVKWKTQENVFGTWLGYSAEHGVLIQSGRPSRDMGLGEPKGRIMALNATDGKVLWDRTDKVSDGPYILHHDMLIMQDSAGGWGVELATGKDVMRPHPITGQPVRWQFSRRYGCNTALASENLLTFRSGAIGYYDMVTMDGTANFGGVKSGCSPCLIAADGVVSAPDYTRTCLCAYPNQCSLALVNMPEMETWKFGGWAKPAGAAIGRLGINFGAAGDRADTAGTLWVDFPSIGFDSPDPQVKVEPEGVKWFRGYAISERTEAGTPNHAWITGSGAIGVRKVQVKLNNPAPRAYTVRLYFAEPEGNTAGRRVFDVALQGRRVIEGLDIAREAGGPGRGIVREFKNIQAGESLDAAFEPATGAANMEPVICGMELVAE